MPLIKRVSNANPGNANLYGGNDLATVADYFNDTDTGNVPRINNPTEIRSGILKIRDSTNAYNITIKSAAQTNSRDFTIPALAGNDSPATLAIPNIFSDIQTVTKDAADLLKLYRPASNTNNLTGLSFQHRNSNNVQTDYAKIYGKVITNTSGLEDGKLVFYVKKAGTDTEVMSIDKNGLLTCTSLSVSPPNPNAVTVLKSSGVITTTASSAAEFNMLSYTLLGNTLGTNGCLRVRISGEITQNNVSSQTFQVKIKFGGTTIFDSITQSVAQQAAARPFLLTFTLGNNNATNSQSGTGFCTLGLADVAATVGLGDIQDDEVQVFSPFGMGASTKDTTADQALLVTMTMSASASTIVTSVKRQIIEYIPGV